MGEEGGPLLQKRRLQENTRGESKGEGGEIRREGIGTNLQFRGWFARGPRCEDWMIWGGEGESEKEETEESLIK